MNSKPFVTAHEVAELLGFEDSGQFLRRRHALEEDHGFPLPMPFGRQTLRWRRSQVLGWIEAHGRPREEAPLQSVTPGARVVLLEEARRA